MLNDILLYRRTKLKHDENLSKVLLRARKKGIKFNPDKCIIGAKEVKYFGHILSSDGMKPDPDKVSAIIGM
jgi:hypothetical protein